MRQLTLLDLPDEILIEILFLLNIKQLLAFSAVSKKAHTIADSDILWRAFLNPADRNKLNNSARHVCFHFFGSLYYAQDRRDRVDHLIKKRLKDPSLTDVQKFCLGAELTKKAIIAGNLTIEDAVTKSSPSFIAGYDYDKVEEIKKGIFPQKRPLGTVAGHCGY